MAPVSHLDSARSRQDAPARPARTGARQAALFASGLQRSDAPTAAMAAEAITATVRRFGIHGCLSRMAQEFGDHPDAAAARMRWICQLTAQMPAWPPAPASAGRQGSRASNQIQASSDPYPAPARGAA
jgi:hypothetical protein